MIYGFQGTTLIDFPGEIASIVFLGGCNFRCPYCYNVDLVLPQRLSQLAPLSLDDVLFDLSQRKGFISGVVITGGEPTIHKEKLIEFLMHIKEKLFLKVKLDTNGSNPYILSKCIKYVDYLAMDIKTSPKNYWIVKGKWSEVRKSLEIIKESNIDHEIRITVAPGVVNFSDIKEMCKELSGIRKVVIQKFVNNVETLDPLFRQIDPYDKDVFRNIADEFAKYLQPYTVVEVR